MGFRYPKFLVPAFLTVLICLFLSSCGKGHAGKIILAGSTSVQPFAELWAEAYAVKHPKVNVIIQGGGSSAGIESALTGTSDIGTSSRELKPEEELDPGGQKKLQIVPVAFDGIAVIVNIKSSLTNISSEQLRSLFAGHIDKLNNQPLTVVTREEGSGTRTSFQESVMKVPGSGKTERISNSALVQDSNGAVREIVAGDPNAIGYISLGLVDKRVKTLAVDNILPTVETVKNGSYKIVRRFLFVLKTRDNPLAEDFIKFCLSPEGQNLVAKKGLIKVGLQRNKLDYLPEMILERDKERRSLSSHCTTQAMSDAGAAQKHLALWGTPSLGHCGVAPRLCAAVGTESSSRLALTSNPGFQIVKFIPLQPLRENIR